MARSNSSELLRSPPFSLQDFQQLVSDAFDLPANDASQRDLHSPFPSLPAVASSVDGHPPTLHAPRPSTSHEIAHPSEQPHRPRTPFELFKSIRTRASALLRPTHTNPSEPVPPLPLRTFDSTPTPSSRPSTAQTARPSVSSQRTAVLSPAPADLDLARSRTHDSPKSFLKLSDREIPLKLPPKPQHYSFFDDSDVPYPRSQSSLSRTHLRVHTRLPPLRKARSNMPSIFSKKSAVSDSGCAPRSSYYYAQSCGDLTYNVEDPRCPSPFTSPREAPKPPPFEDELEVPAYVYERRGSATSENTMSSTRTTSTLAERLSNAFPVSWHLPFSSKSRSKLHLSIASSSHSSPSSSSSHSTSYGSPITPVFPAGYSFPAAVEICQVGTGYGVVVDGTASRHSFSETREEALAIGRVLTPEEDPFAKPEINVEDTTTPKPFGGVQRKRHSDQSVSFREQRRGSAQSEVIPRRQSKADRTYSTPVFSRSLEPEDFPHSVVSPSYTFPSSCSVYPAFPAVSPDSSYSVPPSPSTRSCRSTRNQPPSSWSPWSSPVTEEDSLPSTESSHSDVRMGDFPLPPASIAGLPLGGPVELAPLKKPLPRLVTSHSSPVSPISPTSPFSGLGLSFVSESPSPLARRGAGRGSLPPVAVSIRPRRRERESLRSLRSLPPIPSAYEPEESELLSHSFGDTDRTSSPFHVREDCDESLDAHDSGKDFTGEGLDDSGVLTVDLLRGLGLQQLDTKRSSITDAAESSDTSSFSAPDREPNSSFSDDEDPIDRSIQDLLSDLMAERQLDKPAELHSLSDFINKPPMPSSSYGQCPDTPAPSTSALADSPNTIPPEDTRPASCIRSESFESERALECWDRNTSRSTAFFSARSSTFSFNSAAVRGSPESWGTAKLSVDFE